MPSRISPLGHIGSSCLETPTRVMLLSGYPQATLPGLSDACDRLTSLREPSSRISRRHGSRYRLLYRFLFRFSLLFFCQHEFN